MDAGPRPVPPLTLPRADERTPVNPARQRKRNVNQLESTALHSQDNSNLTPGFRILQGAGRSDSALGCFLQALLGGILNMLPGRGFRLTGYRSTVAVIACSLISVLAIGSRIIIGELERFLNSVQLAACGVGLGCADVADGHNRIRYRCRRQCQSSRRADFSALAPPAMCGYVSGGFSNDKVRLSKSNTLCHFLFYFMFSINRFAASASRKMSNAPTSPWHHGGVKSRFNGSKSKCATFQSNCPTHRDRDGAGVENVGKPQHIKIMK
jgi:hypothetical protein